jgi:hypothetical protein
VTVSPGIALGSESSGVVTFVTLSLFDDPESEDANRSGPMEAIGAAVSISMSRPGPAGEKLPAGSATVADIDHAPSDIAGRSQLVTEGDAT